MWDDFEDLWAWLNSGIDEPVTPPAAPVTIGNYNSLPDTAFPEHQHLRLDPVLKNKGGK